MSEQQKSLFDSEPEAWELDDQEQRTVASVVFPQPPFGPFDYLVPDNLLDTVRPGRRVRTPLGRGNRVLTGYCVELITKQITNRRLKEIRSVIDYHDLLTAAMLRVTKWISDYYLCPFGQTIEAVVPAGVRGMAGTREAQFLAVPNSVIARITQLKLPKKQAEALRILATSPIPLTPQQLADSAQCTTGPINELRRKNLVSVTTRRIDNHDFEDGDFHRGLPHDLNDSQQRALEDILRSLDSRQHETLLIHGVTGSGKTEVYIRAIEEVVQYGRQAIVLVPEIGLTPQTCHRFRSRFQRVAVLHSQLTDSERHWHWKRIASGEIQVVVGARSAVFAPTPNLGLIVIDEEHDASFKQDTAPRYHARDVARMRATLENAPLVLGSATPALESWQRAQEGQFRLINMPHRVLDLPMPDVMPLDLREEFRNKGSRGAISRPLHQAMVQTLSEDGQVILLLNRRGFSTSIQCPACGFVVKCPNCDIALTHHREGDKALCHYCDHKIVAPKNCPDCRFEGIQYSGLGTQRLESEVKENFPGYVCLRMDSDTMRRPGSHERALNQFRKGEAHILVGTQMIAKGLDFPNVTLVGVVNADTALHFPDFRAAERTFQLVTQVAGRTGRGHRGGRVLVQTFSPEHPALQAAMQHDYIQFAELELPTRAQFGYPPYGAMVRLVIRGESETATEHFSNHITDILLAQIEQECPAVRLLGAAPAPVAKLRGKYRYHALLQGPERAVLRKLVQDLFQKVKIPDEIQWIVDVDPLDML
ncbi:MAG: primosomal protein N' (replication factor Y) [Pirellulaceae bacterium]|jgi:primosomal protein N' (replication factor Y)